MTTSVRQHKYLGYASRRSQRRVVREIAVQLMNQYCGEQFSRTRWLKQPDRIVNCFSENAKGERREWQSRPINLRKFEHHLDENARFDWQEFGLIDPRCQWLDAVVGLAPRFPFVDASGGTVKLQSPPPLGADFPLKPALDREGHLINSMQMPLQKQILESRKQLVATSQDFDSMDWFQKLRNCISDCVSLIDVTLHQLYLKAQYDPLPGWSFDAEKLGERHGQRLKDKIKWVHKIAGEHLGAHREMPAFLAIKDVRNHLQHFDPPCFCYTLEDVVCWLNDIDHIANLAWKMRKAIGSPLSGPLIELLLMEKVEFVPSDPSKPRTQQPPDVGYRSSTWPSR